MIFLTGGSFQRPDGSKVANGSISFRLSWDSNEIITTPSGQVMAGAILSFPLDANGNIVIPALIWSNAELVVPTYYIVNVHDVHGRPLLQDPATWIFTVGTGGTQDIGLMINAAGTPTTIVMSITGPTGPSGGPVGPTGPTGFTGFTGPAGVADRKSVV